jgi:hypothetical protein
MLGGSKHVFSQMCKYVQIKIKLLRFTVGGLIGRSHVTFLTDFLVYHIAAVAKQHQLPGGHDFTTVPARPLLPQHVC